MRAGEGSRFGKGLEEAEPRPQKLAAKEAMRSRLAATMTPSQKPRQKARLHGSIDRGSSR